jgi:colanic acid biosynthesis glycosyl transferase WcaI
MRILLHDYSGHPFQAELSRELADRGHDVTHSYNASYVSGKGGLSELDGTPRLRFRALRMSGDFAKYRPWTRLRQEVVYAWALLRHVRAERPDLVLVCNVPLLSHFLFALLQRRVPMVFWQQDVYSQAIGSEAVRRLGLAGRPVALAADRMERVITARSAACIVIADTFLPVHERWGTADLVSVIPNWAPVDELRPRDKDNAWSRTLGLHDRPVLLYSGTLGLKHNPMLLVQLVRLVRQEVPEALLVVVSQGEGASLVRSSSGEHEAVVLPFQPFEDLPEVLGTADVLVTLLQPHASAYSVPSKTLSYLCAGRPVLALMPADNPAAALVDATGGFVHPPDAARLHAASSEVVALLRDPERRTRIGTASRQLAEERFAITGIADQFEKVLHQATTAAEDGGPPVIGARA